MCVHKTDEGFCKKFSVDGVTSYCVEGPCQDEVLSNADRIRSMSGEELAAIFTRYAYESNGKWYGPDEKTYWSESRYALEAWIKWLRQPADETTL